MTGRSSTERSALLHREDRSMGVAGSSARRIAWTTAAAVVALGLTPGLAVAAPSDTGSNITPAERDEILAQHALIGPLDAPEALLLGLPDGGRGRLRVAGRTSALTLPARRELGAMLVPPRRAHPWPERIPSSRFGQLPGDLVDYTPTEPLLVVEVDADMCFEHDRWRHPTVFRRLRADLQADEVAAAP
jgi:hypothetical protein